MHVLHSFFFGMNVLHSYIQVFKNSYFVLIIFGTPFLMFKDVGGLILLSFVALVQWLKFEYDNYLSNLGFKYIVSIARNFERE